MTPAKACIGETESDLARYVSNVNQLHDKLATIATHHRDIFDALNRMAKALRDIKEAYRN